MKYDQHTLLYEKREEIPIQEMVNKQTEVERDEMFSRDGILERQFQSRFLGINSVFSDLNVPAGQIGSA